MLDLLQVFFAFVLWNVTEGTTFLARRATGGHGLNPNPKQKGSERHGWKGMERFLTFPKSPIETDPLSARPQWF